jgi:hypothetical protein
MPEGTVTIPGGLKLKKNVAIGIGIVAVGVGGYYYYRQKKAAAAASAASTSAQSTALDQTGNIDPATGYAYGSPEDQAALNAMQGGGAYGQYGSSGYYLGGPPSSNPQPVPQGFTSNAQWAQAAEQYMGSNGADAIAAALGKYLLGSPLTTDQVTLVQEAIAAEGTPPVPGTQVPGYPPSYKTDSGPPPQQGMVTVPNVVGSSEGPAETALKNLGLKVSGIKPPAKPGHHNMVTAQKPAGGSKVKKGSTVALTIKVV